MQIKINRYSKINKKKAEIVAVKSIYGTEFSTELIYRIGEKNKINMFIVVVFLADNIVPFVEIFEYSKERFLFYKNLTGYCVDVVYE